MQLPMFHRERYGFDIEDVLAVVVAAAAGYIGRDRRRLIQLVPLRPLYYD